MKGDFCRVDDFEPSDNTMSAIDEMNNVINMSSYLSKIMYSVPMFQIFAGRGSYVGVSLGASGWNATGYDWQQLQGVFSSIPVIKRARLEKIAQQAELFASGKDAEFWRCVYNAL